MDEALAKVIDQHIRLFNAIRIELAETINRLAAVKIVADREGSDRTEAGKQEDMDDRRPASEEQISFLLRHGEKIPSDLTREEANVGIDAILDN